MQIKGPGNFSASEYGGATLHYPVFESDRGKVLTFTATASERPTRVENAYAIKAVFKKLEIVKGNAIDGAFQLIDDPDHPGNILFTINPEVGTAGILMIGELEIVPFVPQDSKHPNLPFFTGGCPIQHSVVQWITGVQIVSFTNGNTPPTLPPGLEDVKPTAQPVWDPASQTLLFSVGDFIGPFTNVGAPNIAIMLISAAANVYLRVKCSDCRDFETIGKGSWKINGSVQPSEGVMPGGTYTPTDGVPSTEDPIEPK